MSAPENGLPPLAELPSLAELPPLAELHCHLEATVKPALARTLAARHGLDISGLVGADGHYAWSNFAEFLAAYDAVSETIRDAEDYVDLTRAYFLDCAREGMIYGEVFVSNDHADQVGLSYATFVEAVAEGIKAAEAEAGITGRMILTVVRHYGMERAQATARLAERHPHPYVTGFGIAGDEAHGAHGDFAHAFAMARGAGLGLTAHAGEILGPDSIRAALEAFDPMRLGHGVRAHEDPGLVAELAERGIVLELCPSSNIALGLYPSYGAHPVKLYADRGVKVTLSTDDPAFFHTSIGAEHARVAQAQGFSPERLADFTETAIEAAFCEEEVKTALKAKLAAWRRDRQAAQS